MRAIALAWLDQPGGERRYVEGETRIGRGEQNNVRLTDPSVSRDHAIIRRADGVYLISDLGSANGTFVNDERIHVPRSLAPGDRVKVASSEFTFNLNLAEVSSSVTSDVRLASSVSQFLTLSGGVDIQSYVEGDLRVVTVLFLDLCGFTALSATMSPEQVTLMMNQCFEYLTRTAAHFGGYVDKYMGDAMMVLFGAPHAHDDDPERAVRAAIAMQAVLAEFSERLLRRSGIALEMRVGVNTGEVLAGRVGSGEFSAYTVMGDVVNVASRFEVAARVGHILVGESAHRLTRSIVRYSDVVPMRIRGKTEPIAAYEVVGLRADEIATDFDPRTPFVGRETELRVLARLLARQGGLRSADLVGEAGIGKSRLIAQFRNLHAVGTPCAFVRCLAYEQATPYAAVRALARALLRRLDSQPAATDRASFTEITSPEWAMLVAENPSSTSAVESEALRDRLASTLAGVIRQLALEQGLLVVLDSAERADAASMAVLQLAVASLTHADVMLVVASRAAPADPWPRNARMVPMPPLSHDESRQLLGALLENDPVDPDTVGRLARWSRGSPLDLEGIVHSAREAGTLQRTDGRWRMTSTAAGWIASGASAYRTRSTVQSALDSLLVEERDILRMATLVAQPCPGSLLADACGPATSAQAAICHLVELGYLAQTDGDPEPSYAVRDESTQAVVQASLPQFVRRRLHDRLAQALERRYDPVHPDPLGLKQIAYHFASAGQAWRAGEYLLRSADLAAAPLTADAAVAQYRAIVHEAAALTEPRERGRLEVEIHERIGDVLLWDGNLVEAQIAFELASERSVSEQRRGDLQIKLGLTAVRRGNPQRVLEVADQVVELPNLSLATQANANALAALGLATQGNIRPALERARRAFSIASEVGDQGTLGFAQYALGRVHHLAGNFVAAGDALRQSVEARRQAGDRAAWSESQVTLGLIQCALGELRQAEQAVRSALGPAEQPQRSRQDDNAATRESGRDTSSGSAPPARWNLACAALVLGCLLRNRGEAVRGNRHLSQALRAGQRAGARELVLEARLELAGYHVAVGGSLQPAGFGISTNLLDQAIVDLRSVLDETRALQLVALACRTRIVLSTALFERASSSAEHSSRGREAFMLAREALVVADRLGLALHGAVARRAVGCALTQLGYWSQGAAQLSESASQLGQLGAQVEFTRTLIAAAHAEHAHANPPRIGEVRAKLGRALELAEALGLEADRAAAIAGLQAIVAT